MTINPSFLLLFALPTLIVAGALLVYVIVYFLIQAVRNVVGV